MNHPDRAPWNDLLAFILPLSIYLLLPASTTNGDGLAYYNIALQSDWKTKFLPGHILYCPLMTVLGRVAQLIHPSAFRYAMLLTNQIIGASAVYLLFRTAERLKINTFGRWMAALGLAFSYGFWIQATDIQTYALPVFFVIASIYLMGLYAENGGRRHLLALGVANSIAALFHLTTIFFAATSLCFIVVRHRRAPRRMVEAIGVYIGSLVLFFAVPVLSIGFGILKLTSLAAFLAWLWTSGHGYRLVFDGLSVPRAVYGLARTFLFFEFFYGAPGWIIAVKGLGMLVAVIWVIRRIQPVWRSLAPPARTVLGSGSLFVALQAAFGVYYFGSDTGRWVFIAPLVWLMLAGYLSLLTVSQRRVAVAALCVLFTINLAQAIWPAATDTSTKDRVLALDRLLPTPALIITPGQDWVGYYSFFTPRRAEILELITLAIRHTDDHVAFYEDLERRITRAQQLGKEIFVIRILDPSENHKRSPWQELQAFGYSYDRLRQWIERYEWVEKRLTDPDRTRVYLMR